MSLIFYRYTDKISEDDSFTLEIRQLIRHSSAKILKTFLDADILQIFINEIIPIIIAHIERVIRLIRESCPERLSFEIQVILNFIFNFLFILSLFL